jgi:hypothetical protein
MNTAMVARRKFPSDVACRCRHGSAAHLPRIVVIQGKVCLVPGTGTCTHASCACERFRSRRWLHQARERG